MSTTKITSEILKIGEEAIAIKPPFIPWKELPEVIDL